MRSEAEILLAIRSDLRGAAETIEALKATQKAAIGVGEGFRFAAGSMGAIGLVRAFEQSARAAVMFNAKLESTQLGLAGIYRQFRPQEFATFDKALGASARTVDQLKKAALETTASFDDLLTAYQSIAGAAFSAGIPMEKQVRLTQLLAQAVSGLGLPTWQLPQEGRSILTGTIGPDSTVATALGITNAQVNQAKAQGRLMEFLEQRLSGLSEAGSRANQTFSGQLSNLQDRIGQMFGAAASPAFEAMKGAFTQIGETLARPEVQQGLNNIGAAAGKVIEIGGNIVGNPGAGEAGLEMVKLAGEIYLLRSALGVIGRVGGSVLGGLNAGAMLPFANKAGGALARMLGIGAGEAASISAMEGAAGRFAGGGIGGWISRQMAMSSAGTSAGLAAHGIGRLGGLAGLAGILGWEVGDRIAAPLLGERRKAIFQNAVGLLSDEDLERLITAEFDGEDGNSGLDRLRRKLSGGSLNAGGVASTPAATVEDKSETEHRLRLGRNQMDDDFRNKRIRFEDYFGARYFALQREANLRFGDDKTGRRRFLESGSQELVQMAQQEEQQRAGNVFDRMKLKADFNSGRFSNAGSLYGFANSIPTLKAMLDELKAINAAVNRNQAVLR